MCIQPTITGRGPCIVDQDIIIGWTYDATIGACIKIRATCTAQFSQNFFISNTICEHFCHDVGMPGSGNGFTLT